MIYSQKRINEICESRNMPISQLEQACGFSNGYINTERKREFPTDRLFKILDFLAISYEEFYNVGSKQTQTIETAFAQIKKASPEVYEDIMTAWTEKAKKPATESDGQAGDDYSISDKDRKFLNWFRSLPPKRQKAILISQDAPEDLL